MGLHFQFNPKSLPKFFSGKDPSPIYGGQISVDSTVIYRLYQTLYAGSKTEIYVTV